MQRAKMFTGLKGLGKFIANSGQDIFFTDAVISEPTIAEKIKQGKHMKTSFKAFIIIYIILNTPYYENGLEKNLDR